jgi:DNA (cytosine-5)-methyltransferase 1
LKPAGIIVENVPQIGNGKKGSVLQVFCRALQSAGYSFAYRTVDAKDFGVPQRRRRLVLLGIKGIDEDIELPSPNGGTRRTVRDAIGGLPPVRAGEAAPRRPMHRAARLSTKNLKRLEVTPHNGGDSRTWPKSLKLPCHVRSQGFYDVYGRMRWDGPAPTLTTRCNSLSNGRFGHPVQNRAMTLLEAAILQTFPRSYHFAGNQNDVARQIGNAVPPKLAEALARSLLKHL